jgi:nucleoside-diphosphate-sugar epimerase
MSPTSPLLCLGATSLIGGALSALPDRPPVICVSRRPPPGGTKAPDRWITADLSDAADLSVRDVETALGLAPIWVVAPAVEALARSGITRIVVFSSTSRWTKTRSADPTEREIADRLARSEDAFIDACIRLGIGWTLLRPTLIYLEGRDGNVSRLARLARRFGAIPLAGTGAGLRQPVHAEDLARAALAVLDHPATRGRAYDLPGGETLSYRAMVERVFEGLGRRPRVIPVPPVLWRAGFTVAGRLLPGANAQMGARMEVDLTFDAGPAQRDFNWRPRDFRPRFPA